MTDTIPERVIEYRCQKAHTALRIGKKRLDSDRSALRETERIRATMERWFRRQFRGRQDIVFGPVQVYLHANWMRDEESLIARMRYFVCENPAHEETLRLRLIEMSETRVFSFPQLAGGGCHA